MAPVSTVLDAVRTCGASAPLAVRVLRAPLRALLWLVLRTGLRIRVEGSRHDGAAVVVSNHPNLVDGMLVLMADAHLRPVARWHRSALVRAGLWVGNCVITTTGTPVSPARGAYLRALTHVRGGGRVWIAPEGGWQPRTTLRRPHSGAVRLAHAAQAPLQVLAIIYDRHPGPDVARWPLWTRPAVTLRWGPCVPTTGDVDHDLDRMMSALAAAAGMTWTSPPVAQDA